MTLTPTADMRISQVQDVGSVAFPSFREEKLYMLPFFQDAGLPAFARHWQGTVDAMLSQVRTASPIFLMVDAARVPAGTAHRRGGVHVDGYWHPNLEGLDPDVQRWVAQLQQRIGAAVAGGHGQHRSVTLGGHGEHRRTRMGGHGEHRATCMGGHGEHRRGGLGQEALILASNVAACRAYLGAWEGNSGAGGDCAHVDVSGMPAQLLDAGRAWAGDTSSLLHETLVCEQAVERVVLRLNVPDPVWA
jgi:hypothetical protein